MLGNIHNEVLQCFNKCLLLLMRIRTDAPGLGRYIYTNFMWRVGVTYVTLIVCEPSVWVAHKKVPWWKVFNPSDNERQTICSIIALLLYTSQLLYLVFSFAARIYVLIIV